MKSVLRTCFILLFVLGRGPAMAAPMTSYSESDHELPSNRSEASKKSFQRSLSGLYSIDSWKNEGIAQPYSDFDQLYLAAAHAQQELDTVIREISLVTSTQAILPGVKSQHRAKTKVDTELQGNTNQITDLARGSLVAEDIPSLVQAFELLNKEVTVVAVKNRFKSPTDSGYRDLKLLVQLPESQIIAEVQLHLDAISTVKNGAEHEIYEQIQEIERVGLQQKRPLSEFELAQIAQLRTVSSNLYQEAWQHYLQPEVLAS
ncbi:phosphoribosylglycinamide formyltransferase [Photobacterium sp. OFAV2-7]|uniref:phosphoribosylglycinamide formyltransferase n=1 Tax=Photobacterium sp. OFAV2-7 TaxID=2917748 RepID=UPI001EF62DB4|nr:phosphoribosylglycinamide formyltransferase [Photobacterium sp. OFAV2-7]MCG7587604.1 phosphoribosylglycinamide formyltransferase [Photobacterium sp. OFAV2-7]